MTWESEKSVSVSLTLDTRENPGPSTLDNATKMLGYKKNWNLPKIVLQKKLDYWLFDEHTAWNSDMKPFL